MQDQAPVPYHLSEKMFKRYAPYIRVVVRNYPQRSLFPPGQWSEETFKCRFRDACRSLLTYHWPSGSDIDETILKKVSDEMVVVSGKGDETGLIVIKCPSDVTEAALPQEALEATPGPVVDSPDIRILYALALLLDKKIIHGPFLLKNVVEKDLDEVINRNYDIATKQNEDGTILLF